MTHGVGKLLGGASENWQETLDESSPGTDSADEFADNFARRLVEGEEFTFKHDGVTYTLKYDSESGRFYAEDEDRNRYNVNINSQNSPDGFVEIELRFEQKNGKGTTAVEGENEDGTGGLSLYLGQNADGDLVAIVYDADVMDASELDTENGSVLLERAEDPEYPETPLPPTQEAGDYTPVDWSEVPLGAYKVTEDGRLIVKGKDMGWTALPPGEYRYQENGAEGNLSRAYGDHPEQWVPVSRSTGNFVPSDDFSYEDMIKLGIAPSNIDLPFLFGDSLEEATGGLPFDVGEDGLVRDQNGHVLGQAYIAPGTYQFFDVEGESVLARKAESGSDSENPTWVPVNFMGQPEVGSQSLDGSTYTYQGLSELGFSDSDIALPFAFGDRFWSTMPDGPVEVDKNGVIYAMVDGVMMPVAQGAFKAGKVPSGDYRVKDGALQREHTSKNGSTWLDVNPLTGLYEVNESQTYESLREMGIAPENIAGHDGTDDPLVLAGQPFEVRPGGTVWVLNSETEEYEDIGNESFLPAGVYRYAMNEGGEVDTSRLQRMDKNGVFRDTMAGYFTARSAEEYNELLGMGYTENELLVLSMGIFDED